METHVSDHRDRTFSRAAGLPTLALAVLLAIVLPASHVAAKPTALQLRASRMVGELLLCAVLLGALCAVVCTSRRVALVRGSTILALLAINGAVLASAVAGDAGGQLLWLTVPWSAATLYSVLQPAEDVLRTPGRSRSGAGSVTDPPAG